MTTGPAATLKALRNQTLKIAGSLDDKALRAQFHPSLSPIGWHAGHCGYVESYWIREALLKQSAEGAGDPDLYIPDRIPKPERGKRLPKKAVLLETIRAQQLENIDLLNRHAGDIANESLMNDNYLLHFLAQHYAQHLETMQAILAQKVGTEAPQAINDRATASTNIPKSSIAECPGGTYNIGGSRPLAYDNELPAHQKTLPSFGISRSLATNSEYVDFIRNDGYSRAELWNPVGYQWVQDEKIRQPGLWRTDLAGNYLIALHDGYHQLNPGEPVCSLSWYEADAFARWKNGRLVNEFEWEAAHQTGLLDDVGGAWEWCANAFAPYDGFSAFPYREYSEPWFDGKHRVLRGGSPWTQDAVRRPSFRNFYAPETRFMYAGVRVAYP